MRTQSKTTLNATDIDEGKISIDRLWHEVKPYFGFDGGWRDIYVFDTTLDDWSRIAAAIQRSGSVFRFEGAWTGSQFPPKLDILFTHEARDISTMLSLDTGGVRFVCHFFEQESAEFDFDPREVCGESELSAVLVFMGKLATACQKPAVLAPENSPQLAFLEVLP